MSKSLLDDWNDPHNRKMRELYAEQDRKMQAQDGNSDAADLAALRAENARLRELLKRWVTRFPVDEQEWEAGRNLDYAKLLRDTRAALAWVP